MRTENSEFSLPMDVANLSRQIDELGAISLIYPDEVVIDDAIKSLMEVDDPEERFHEFQGLDNANLSVQFNIPYQNHGHDSGSDAARARIVRFEFSLPQDYPEQSSLNLKSISPKMKIESHVEEMKWIRNTMETWKKQHTPSEPTSTSQSGPGVEQLLEAMQFCFTESEKLFSLASSEGDLERIKQEKSKPPGSGSDSGMKMEWSRLGILFVHIKTPSGRKQLVQWARKLDLTGIERAGRPGFVYIEGFTSNVEAYVSLLRGQGWGKFLSLTNREDMMVLANAADIDAARCFPDFKEIEVQKWNSDLGSLQHLFDDAGIGDFYRVAVNIE